MKIITTQKYVYAQQYKSDDDIKAEFNNFQVVNIEVGKSGKSGWVELYFPDAGESVGGGAQNVTDNWIKYDHNGKIAFDNWYPPEVSQKIIAAIEQKLQGNSSGIKPNLVDNT